MTEPDSTTTAKDHFKEMRKLYPLKVYGEEHWEIYDEVEARVIAHFFFEEEALAYIEWQNKKAQEDE
jgi:hypothetical protein